LVGVDNTVCAGVEGILTIGKLRLYVCASLEVVSTVRAEAQVERPTTAIKLFVWSVC
jgi:hypothetical protein